MKKISILLVEDESAIRDMLRFSFSPAEFDLKDAESVAQAKKALAEKIPDIMILDWMLPDKSGIDFLKWMRQQELYKDIPVIMLTAKAEEENKIKGLISGADDYVTKPFSPDELIARIKTVLRRGPLVSTGGEIRIGELSVNINEYKVTVGNEPLQLTPIEYKMLHFFMTHPNKTYTRDHLITHIRGGNVYIDDRTVDVQVRRLRDKLKPYKLHTWIKTVRGAGYYFSKDDDEKTF